MARRGDCFIWKTSRQVVLASLQHERRPWQSQEGKGTGRRLRRRARQLQCSPTQLRHALACFATLHLTLMLVSEGRWGDAGGPAQLRNLSCGHWGCFRAH